jgi:hypothetical protein
MINLSDQSGNIVLFSRKSSFLLVASIFLLLASSCSLSSEKTEVETTSTRQIRVNDVPDADVFKIENSEEVLLNAVNIMELYDFGPDSEYISFRLIVTGPTAATDYGTYSKLVLVFNNGTEYPNRTSVFELGNVGGVYSVELITPERVQIKVHLLDIIDSQYTGDVTMDVDLSAVIAEENRQIELTDAIDGTMPSYVTVRVLY